IAHKPSETLNDEDIRSLMYCDFEDPKAKDVSALQPRMNALLDEYNSVAPKPMNLVLFLFAIEHRRKGVYGPPLGKKMAVFVDDLNMPVLELYGAQPPIELLRQWMDHGGWYDLKENSFRRIVDLTFIGAMGPPGGGRNPITGRFMRHFNIIAFTEFDDGSMVRIFQTVLDWWLDRSGFDDSFRSRSSSVIAATMGAYKASVENLLPTPTKSHYTFNLRDFSRVVQGILLTRKEDFAAPSELVAVWLHELLRVFYDRLTVDADRSWFLANTTALVKDHFDLSIGVR
ncbi:P-loop containing dynein motor region D3-domain-containing protein, partial [Pavlovales sp. CCMP2436]